MPSAAYVAWRVAGPNRGTGARAGASGQRPAPVRQVSLTTVGLAVLVVAVACAVHGAVGFGMNLLAVPVLAALDPTLLPGPAVAAGLVLSLLVLARERVSVDPSLAWAVVGLAPGTLLGSWVLSRMHDNGVSVLAGCLVLVAVALSLMRVDLSPTRWALLVAGAASGFLATAASIGGPPMALLYSHARGPDLRARLSAFFVVTALASLLALRASGHFDDHDATASALLLPGVLVGFLCSGPLRGLLDRKGTRPAVLALSAVAAVGAIVEGVGR
jgi:uncharacterized membrane protein YfcA